jgi:branched-chain amino acid transport system permease protein
MRQTEYWRAMLGFAILALVLVFPQGVAGSLRARFDRGEARA